MNLTVITAFMSNINQRGDRDIQKYVDLGCRLLDVNLRQIVFMERRVFEMSFRGRYMHFPTSLPSVPLPSVPLPSVPLPSVPLPSVPLPSVPLPSVPLPSVPLSDRSPENFDFDTSFVYEGREYEYAVFGRLTFVFFEKSDMYLESVRETITSFSVDTPHPAKDTLDYMFVQCHKTEWVAMAIALDASRGDDHGSELYVWLDFGIRHMFSSDIACDMALYGLRDRVVGKCLTGRVIAPSCWNASNRYYQDVYRNIFWVFAGSVFGGDAAVLREFARRTKAKCLSIVREHHHLMWEVNVWYLVFLDCREMFALYYGDHNATILRGFGLE